MSRLIEASLVFIFFQSDASIRYKVIQFSTNIDIYKYNFDENKLVICVLPDYNTINIDAYDNLSIDNKKTYFSHKILRKYEDNSHFYCIIYLFFPNPFSINGQHWYAYYINELV